MTEDDTFDRLRRISFEEMEKIYLHDNNAHLCMYIEYTDKLLIKYGWTRNEFMEKWYKR